MTKLIKEYIDEGVTRDSKQDLDTLYKAWDEVKGIIKGGDPKLSSSVDETLYGEKGVWRGDPGKTALHKVKFDEKK